MAWLHLVATLRRATNQGRCRVFSSMVFGYLGTHLATTGISVVCARVCVVLDSVNFLARQQSYILSTQLSYLPRSRRRAFRLPRLETATISSNIGLSTNLGLWEKTNHKLAEFDNPLPVVHVSSSLGTTCQNGRQPMSQSRMHAVWGLASWCCCPANMV